MKLSILIRTLNEEANLPELLENTSWCDDIVLVDSGSTDETLAIAEAASIKTIHKSWDGDESKHFNWIMENIDFQNEWVLLLDADERVTPSLVLELEQLIGNPEGPKYNAYYIGRKNILMGKWLKYSMPSTPVLRMFKRGKIRWERRINTTTTVEGGYGYLSGLLEHYNFSKGISEWLERHNRYATYEAEETVKTLEEEKLEWKNIFSSDVVRRRAALKNLSCRIPCRALIKFLYMYLFRFGFLDGRAGLLYCTLQYLYEYMIVVKVVWLKSEKKQLLDKET